MNQGAWILKLYRGNILLGSFDHIAPFYFPWYQADFHPTLEFEPYRSLFDEELRLLESEGATDAWAAAYEEIDDLQLTLVDTQQSRTTEIFVLHMEGRRVRFKVYFDPTA
jgi:hypothetical protein